VDRGGGGQELSEKLSSEKVISGPLEVPKGGAKAEFELARLNTENILRGGSAFSDEVRRGIP
jgi:hypothetical protein